jgi:hypothetical protein
LSAVQLVFLSLGHVEATLSETQILQESHLDSLCILELHSPLPSAHTETQLPFINIIGINVFLEEQRLVCHGLPFVLIVNRTCGYSELCRKLLEVQSRHFKDRNMLKYKVRAMGCL